MLNAKSFLAVDFGAGTLKLAEFEVNEGGSLRLRQYAMRSLGAEGAQESTREAAILKALQSIITEKGIKSKNVNVCAPGFHVFSKFVKLPPVEASKVTQIIQYEAQQNVPFPLAEVVWDYQILGSAPGGELEVLLVAIKADIVEGLFRVTESAGLHLLLADVSPAALCNAFRYNYGELEDCTMLLDIGAKTSNLLFFEKGKVFSRSINLGANSITQDFANESKLKFDAAEKIKIEEGFVSLGGAYEEPENPHQAAISKIARQFMTRLHIQVNQTMQFYRGQQGGSAPQRLFLSGGASVMPYAAQFFAEKLNIPVEYFNPLRNVDRDPSINVEDLGRVAHSMGEVVGLGLRNLAHCPVELNLMPDSTLKWQSFNQKKPYFIATVFSLVLAVFAIGFLFDKLAGVKNEAYGSIHPEVEKQQGKSARFKKEYHENLKKTQEGVDQVMGWMDNRFYWADVLSELRSALIRAEDAMGSKLRTSTGVWIEQFTSATNAPEGMDQGLASFGAPAPGPVVSSGMDAAFRRRYGLEPGPTAPPAPAPPPAEVAGAAGGDGAALPVSRSPRRAKGGAAAAGAAGASGDTNEISSVTITFRAVSLINVSGQPEADKATAFQVLSEIQKSPLFDPDPQETKFSCDVSSAEPPGTFTFCVLARLKNPLKL